MTVMMMNIDGEWEEAHPISMKDVKIVGSVDLNENGWLAIQVRHHPAIQRYIVGLESDGEFIPIKEFHQSRTSTPMQYGVSIALEKLANYCAILSQWQSEQPPNESTTESKSQ